MTSGVKHLGKAAIQFSEVKGSSENFDSPLGMQFEGVELWCG